MSAARILVVDLESQRGIVETFSLRPYAIGIDQVQTPSRILCFAAKWYGEDKIIFKSAWDDDDQDAYRRMMQAMWDLLNEAHFVVGWNSDRFDLQWFESEFLRLGMGRPAPYKSIDLIKALKRWFKGGLMSMKLDWSARTVLKDRKTPHGGTDLWWDIRHGTRDEKRAARKIMREYNIHDVELTDRLFEKYRPYLNINVAIYEEDSGIALRCTKCGSMNLKKDGVKHYNTLNSLYQIHRCKDCGGSSRGAQVQARTPLRPV